MGKSINEVHPNQLLLSCTFNESHKETSNEVQLGIFLKFKTVFRMSVHVTYKGGALDSRYSFQQRTEAFS